MFRSDGFHQKKKGILGSYLQTFDSFVNCEWSCWNVVFKTSPDLMNDAWDKAGEKPEEVARPHSSANQRCGPRTQVCQPPAGRGLPTGGSLEPAAQRYLPTGGQPPHPPLTPAPRAAGKVALSEGRQWRGRQANVLGTRPPRTPSPPKGSRGVRKKKCTRN